MFKKSEKGSALVLAGIVTIIMVVSISGFIAFVLNEFNITKKSLNIVKAFYIADGGLQYAEYYISSNSNPSNLENYAFTTNGGTAYLTITKKSSSSYLYDVTSTATVNGATKRLSAVIMKDPPSGVFDYVYFINNWGYMWGSSITLYGDARSNGHFGIKYNPTINGNLYAHGNIHYGSNYNQELSPSNVNGLASDPDHWHPHADKLEMPNLYNMSFYENLATTQGGKIWIGPPSASATSSNTIVDGVYGDDEDESDNLILTTNGSSEVIHIDGPVVIRGNVIIRGKVTGRGCIYAGKNIYFVGDTEYYNPPDYASKPWNIDDPNYETEITQWVEENRDKDLVGYAAQENIIGGNWTRSNWYPNYYRSMWESWGAEDVGEDGIPNTNDEGEGDGIWQQEYEDVDGDGVYDDNYSYERDVVPTDSEGNPLQYTDFDNRPTGCNNFNSVCLGVNIQKVQGILYTNHLVPMGVLRFELDGTIVSKDEAIVYGNYITMKYDDRIHSRFRDYDDPNFLSIELPRNLTAKIVYWEED